MTTTGKEVIRQPYWDVVKGLAIILVIAGHSLQYSCRGESFVDNPIWKFIYGFHMPLFMLVSGYFFYFSIQKHTYKDVFIARVKQCILPILTLTIVSSIVLFKFSPSQFLSGLIGDNYWFLWVLFFLSILFLFINKVKITLPLCIALYISTFFWPSLWLLEYVAYMFPYFATGFLFNKYHIGERMSYNSLVIMTIISGSLYFVLCMMMRRDTFIYWSHYSVLEEGLHQLLIDIQRTLNGFCGSFFIMGALKLIYGALHSIVADILTYMGRNTLQLYMISTFPVFFIIEIHYAQGHVNYLLSIGSFILVTLLSIGVIEILKKNYLTNFFFFGQGKFFEK